MSSALINRGLYSIPEANRLTGVPARTIRRWIEGYSYARSGEKFESTPLWHSSVFSESIPCIDFLDLIELRVVDAILKEGVSLHAVRAALIKARELFQVDRPFSSSCFKTDGKSVFLEIQKDSDDPKLIDLIKNQYAINRVLEPSFKNIDFNNTTASRWWPLSRKSSVILDPKLSFGAPVVNETFVPTAVLVNAVDQFGSVRAAAKWFDVSISSVNDALSFEKGLSGRQLAA